LNRTNRLPGLQGISQKWFSICLAVGVAWRFLAFKFKGCSIYTIFKQARQKNASLEAISKKLSWGVPVFDGGAG
jgi:hypothetical protein